MSENRYPSQKLDQYMLRFPDGMRDRVKAAAEANNRSMNAEIVATLEEKYPAPVKTKVIPISNILSEVLEKHRGNDAEAVVAVQQKLDEIGFPAKAEVKGGKLYLMFL